jgi:hypothetical protein
MSTSNEDSFVEQAVFTEEEVHTLLQEDQISSITAEYLLRLSYNDKGRIHQKPENIVLDAVGYSEVNRLKDLAFVYNQRGKKRDDLGVGIENPKFNYYRASGDCICPTCGEIYYDHPVIRGKERRMIGIELYVLCNTDRVKT